MIKYLLILSFAVHAVLFGQISFELNDHLDAEKLKKNTEQLQHAQPAEQIVISIDSSSAELPDVLDFSKILFQTKQEKGGKVIVYIHDQAIGPSAIIPFLADERYGSPYMSWGDIRSGNETGLPANILRTQVTGLISAKQPQAELLRNVAAAMSDANAPLVDTKGNGETLVLNQTEVEKLKLVKSLLNFESFKNQFSIQEEVKVAEAPVQHIKFNANGPNTIGYLKIVGHDSQISQSTWIYVKKALEYYKKSRPIFIILELDTPGGEVFAAQKISDALKDMDTQEGIPVVSFINNWAISAGAMLAYSTRYITVVKDGSMGAAEPVYAGENGQMQSASEKVNSAIRADFANRAAFFGRNPAIAEAMVDKDTVLVMRNGKILKLDSPDQIRRTGANPDKVISNKGKLLTLNATEMVEYGVANMMLSPAKLVPLTPEEQETGQWPASKSLVFEDSFFKDIPNATIDMYQMDWKTFFLSLLTSPMVSSALFLGMILGFYIEFNSGGFGLAGTVGVTCLLLIIISSLALEIGNMLELILIAIGVAILVIEIFVVPTFGLLGIIGILFFLAGVIGLMLPDVGQVHYEYNTGTFNAAGELIMERLGWYGATIALAVVLMGVLGRYLLPSFTGYNRLVLRGGEQDASKGYYAGETNFPKVGEIGKVATPLRPSGKIEVNGVYYEATSGGDFVETDAPIVVEKIVGNLVFVTRTDKKS